MNIKIDLKMDGKTLTLLVIILLLIAYIVMVAMGKPVLEVHEFHNCTKVFGPYWDPYV